MAHSFIEVDKAVVHVIRFQIGKGVGLVCILSPYLFSLYAEYIMRNVRLDEAQIGIKIAGRNINNLRYADDSATANLSYQEDSTTFLSLSIRGQTEWKPQL